MKIFYQILTSVFLVLLVGQKSFAQYPACQSSGSNKIYYVVRNSGTSTVSIYDYDPAVPISSANPSLNTTVPSFPQAEAGLAVVKSLGALSMAPTFYLSAKDSVSGLNQYYKYDGTSWINTGHTAGAINPGAGGGFIYNLVIGNGDVYKYDGSGNATLITNLVGWAFPGGHYGPVDLAADCEGNFYALRTVNPQRLEKYDPSGNLVQFWTPQGLPTWGNASLVIIGDTVYTDIGQQPAQIWKGVMNGPNINFSFLGYCPLKIEDGASCSRAVPIPPVSDTVYYCGSGAGVTVTAQGQAPYSWSVLSGTANINGTGQNVTVTALSNATILVTSDGGECGARKDTVQVIVPTATVYAGIDIDLISCRIDTIALQGFLTNMTPWINYDPLWLPASAIIAGGNTLAPLVAPQSTTSYILQVGTDSLHGGCIWADTVHIAVADSAVTADFDYELHYGCSGDSLVIQNNSINASSYAWNFRDGTHGNSQDPLHIYFTQGIYNVTLQAGNGSCTDTITKIIDTQHPLKAAFSMDNDTICEGEDVVFTNTSIYTIGNGPASFLWSFPAGLTDTSLNTVHRFPGPGVQTVTLVVTDFIPCSDTVRHLITVDPYPAAGFPLTDTIICEGKRLEFVADYTQEGLVNSKWNFGDGTVAGFGNAAAHAYDTSGVFNISLALDYRACPDTTIFSNLKVNPFPVIDLGRDTTMCPNSPALVLADRINQLHPDASWKWNTGDTTAVIFARHPGIYTAMITIDGCSSNDSIEVFKDCYIDIPNSFTPNGDGVNDYFFPREQLSKSLTAFRMSIFNRWGQLIFETENVDGRGWDGKFNGRDQPTGVYIYLIEATINNQQHEKYTGNLTLIR